MSNLIKSMELPANEHDFIDNILQNSINFNTAAISVFQSQYAKNEVYRGWCNSLGINADKILEYSHIPFLPISFFKTHQILNGNFIPEVIFESSGTTQTINSKHFVKDFFLYEKSFTLAFEREYGSLNDLCVIGLLPSYLERQNSSLVAMVNKFIQKSPHKESGFYLYEYDRLRDTLQQLESKKIKTLLIGVTFGLLDFAEACPMQLNHTIVMETGGMKGRREEMTREEVHNFLKKQLGVSQIHSEYGMTELLSQAYSKGEGLYRCPPWMKVLVRDEEDPLTVKISGKGVLNIIDLANIHSCSFIATDDVGTIYDNGSFEVHGRRDNSDLRGCSLMIGAE